MGNHTKKLIVVLFVLGISCSQGFALDAQKDGPVYGDPQGLERVKKLEEQLHTMTIRKDHPRIFITAESLDLLRVRAKMRHYDAFNDILTLAEKGDIVNLAFAYLMLEKENPQSASLCAQRTIKALIETDPDALDKGLINREIAKMGLAFDWVYNAMTEKEKKAVAERLAQFADINTKAEKIRNGYREFGETFHREEWISESYNTWPEIALAHHNPNAEFVYKSRWNYNWFYGDAARMYAYAADGTPFEGYYCGADGVDWLLPLKTATGINLVDGNDFPWCKSAAFYTLYRLDFERGREIFHHGVFSGAAGCTAYREGTVAWKIKSFFGRTLPLAQDNPYILWVVQNEIPLSNWIFGTVGYQGMGELDAIGKILFEDLNLKTKSLKDATYEDLPFARLFTGGNEAYMRTGWINKPACIGFRSSPAYTKTSHGDFDVNTFVIYKDGVLSPDSGLYDAYAGQNNYFRYQKNTGAHNDIVVINPSAPDEPRKLVGGTPDPGGVECVSTRTFGCPSKWGIDNSFLHNPGADWAKIIDFKTTSRFDYVIGEAAKAYGNRLNEYIRSLVFIRKGNNAYVVIFDRVEAKAPKYIKKSLLHLVSEPKMSGEVINSKVPNHYETFKADFFESANAFGTSKLSCKVLLPLEKNLVKIGGDGYDFYVEGSKPTNYPIPDSEIKRVEEHMGGVWQEAGRWRIEIIPSKMQKRDYFMQVMYISDYVDSLNPENVSLKDEGNYFIANIKDDILKDIAVKFSKTGKPEVSVKIAEGTK